MSKQETFIRKKIEYSQVRKLTRDSQDVLTLLTLHFAVPKYTFLSAVRTVYGILNYS